MKKIKVNSNNQSGGITAGIIKVSKGEAKKPKSKLSKYAAIATIIAAIITILTFLNFDNMFKKQDDSSPKVNEVYDVKSENQTGGITAGKIENLNILTDKKSLRPKSPTDIYKSGIRIGQVVNPAIDENKMIFTFEAIELDEPIPNDDLDFFASPFEFGKYIVQASNIDSASITPPRAKGIKGKIIEKK